MTKDEFATHLAAMHCAECEVRSAGQAEYAHSDCNAFGNFERLAAMLDLSRETVLLVYAYKHFDGIVSYINGHKSQRESVHGRIKDLRMYLALLDGMIAEDEAEKSI